MRRPARVNGCGARLDYPSLKEKGEEARPLPLLFSIGSASSRRRVAARDGRQDRLQRVGRRLPELRALLVVLVGGRVVVERQSRDDAAYLHGVERLALQQRLGETHHHVAVLLDDVARALVLLADDALDLLVDLDGRVLGEVSVLRDLAAEENLLLLLAEGERAERKSTRLNSSHIP